MCTSDSSPIFQMISAVVKQKRLHTGCHESIRHVLKLFFGALCRNGIAGTYGLMDRADMPVEEEKQ